MSKVCELVGAVVLIVVAALIAGSLFIAVVTGIRCMASDQCWALMLKVDK